MPRLSPSLSRQFVRFVIAGAINTAIGYGLFLVGHFALALHASIANGVAFALSLVIAYWLYHRFVFRPDSQNPPNDTSKDPAQPLRFAVSVAGAFALNQGVLWLGLAVGAPAPISQLAAMASYTASMFALNKVFVFRA